MVTLWSPSRAQLSGKLPGFHATRHMGAIRTPRMRHKAQASAQGHGGTRERCYLQVVSQIFVSFFGQP